jgi:hypothetical protein
MKILSLKIENCEQCPYNHYNPHYSRSTDSGYDCTISNRRIINDGDFFGFSKITIPSFCTLTDFVEPPNYKPKQLIQE